MKNVFKGVITNLITPFDDGGNIDEESLRKLVEFQIVSGVDGLSLFSYMGEGFTISTEEKRTVVEVVLEQVNKRIPVFVNFSTVNTGDIISKSNFFGNAGVAGIVLSSPNVSKKIQKGIKKHVEEIADNINIPLLFNTMPYNYDGIEENLDIENMLDIMDKENVAGVVLTRTSSILKISSLKKPESLLLTSNDFKTPAYVFYDINGILSDCANVIPGQIKYILDEIQKFFTNSEIKDLKLIKEEFKNNKEIIEHLTNTTPLTMKYYLSKVRKIGPVCRFPFLYLEADEIEKSNKIINDTFNMTITDEDDDYQSI